MRIPGWHCGLVALCIACAFAVSCSRDPFEARVKDLPRRFQVGGKGYIISEQEPGVIDDDAVAYTADAGARTFNFNTRTVLRHLYAGRWDTFDSLPPDELRETEDLANGALDLIRRLERRQHQLIRGRSTASRSTEYIPRKDRCVSPKPIDRRSKTTMIESQQAKGVTGNRALRCRAKRVRALARPLFHHWVAPSPPGTAVFYQPSRFSPGTKSKCWSRLSSGKPCCRASAAIQRSFPGIGCPLRFSSSRTSA